MIWLSSIPAPAVRISLQVPDRSSFWYTLHQFKKFMLGWILQSLGWLANAIPWRMGYAISALVAGGLRELESYRAQLGIQVIPTGMTIRRVYRLLKSGGVVAVAFDVPASLDNGGVPVRFFDGTIVAPAGPARMALRTGAVIAAGACVRQPDGRFLGWFKPPIRVQRTGDEEHDVRALSQAIARECEDFIRQHPDQWYIFRRMWVEPSALS